MAVEMLGEGHKPILATGIPKLSNSSISKLVRGLCVACGLALYYANSGPGGACVNGKCDCDRFKNQETSVDNEVRSCDLRACEQLCRRLGFPGGACVNGKCDCDRFKNQETSVDNEVRSCDLKACEQLCRRLGFPGGACVNGKCDCDRLKNKVIKKDEEVRSCDLRACEQLCRRLGFPGGACVKGKCDCDRFKSILELLEKPQVIQMLP